MSNELPENLRERAQFDQAASLHGGPLEWTVAQLTLWYRMAPADGSYREQLAIMANEVRRAVAERQRADELEEKLRAERRRCATIASDFSSSPNRRVHPDIPWEKMNETAKIVAHTTAQQIAALIEEGAPAESVLEDRLGAALDALEKTEALLASDELKGAEGLAKVHGHVYSETFQDDARAALKLRETVLDNPDNQGLLRQRRQSS